MGSFLNNVVVPASSAVAVAAACADSGLRPSYVAQVGEDCVIFADMDVLMPRPAVDLSARLSRVVLAVNVHDDDILSCTLAANGAAVCGWAVPDPMEYFDIPDDAFAGLSEAERQEFGLDDDEAPADPEALAGAFPPADAARIVEIFGGDYVFASDRLADLLAELGLPAVAARTSHRYLSRGEATDPELTLHDVP